MVPMKSRVRTEQDDVIADGAHTEFEERFVAPRHDVGRDPAEHRDQCCEERITVTVMAIPGAIAAVDGLQRVGRAAVSDMSPA